MIKLTFNDSQRLCIELSKFPGWKTTSVKRQNKLLEMGLPDNFVDELELDGSSTSTAAYLISLLKNMGHLEDKPTHYALGVVVEHLLKNSLDIEGKTFLAYLLDRYQLITDTSDISAEYNLFKISQWNEWLDFRWNIERQPQFTWQSAIDVSSLEKAWKKNVPFLDAVFLEKGAKACRAVCQVEPGDKGTGTGFLIAPNLVLTNSHVIKTDAEAVSTKVRFGYRIDESGQLKQGEVYQGKCIVRRSSVENLDYLVLELEDSPGLNSEIGYLKPIAGEIKVDTRLYIIQHPSFNNTYETPQKVVLQGNKVTHVAKNRVQYMTNTEHGSSGSPVFNEKWEIVALHHSEKPTPSVPETMGIKGNEGILMAAILPEIKDLIPD